MNQDFTVPCIYFTLGVPLLFSYFFLYFFESSRTVLDKFRQTSGRFDWHKIKWFKRFSTLISFVSAIYLFYYFTWGNNNNGIIQEKIFGIDYELGGKYFIYVGFLLLLAFSLLWIPSFRVSANVSSLVLIIIGIGAILVMSSLATTSLSTVEDKVALAASVIIVFQTCIIDALLWSGRRSGKRSARR